MKVELTAIGARIAELRGNLSQADFATMLGIDRKTVGTWERGERLPDTRGLLALWGEFDADPAWVLTGKGFAPTTTDDERELMAAYRSAPLAVKMAAVAALNAGSAAKEKPTGPKQVFHGRVGKSVNVEGDLHQRDVKISMGKKKK